MKIFPMFALASVLGFTILAGCKKAEPMGETAAQSSTPAASKSATEPGGELSLADYEKKMADREMKGREIAKGVGTEIQSEMASSDQAAALPKVAEALKKSDEAMSPLNDEMRALTPPADLKEWHEKKLKDLEEKKTLLDALIAVCEKADLMEFKNTVETNNAENAKIDGETKELLRKAGYDPEAYDKDMKFVKTQ